MHIGLIGGIGPAATEFYYRHLVRAHADADKVMDLTIVHADIATLTRNMVAGDEHAQAPVFAELIGRLKSAGAEAAAVTSLGGHFCINKLIPISPLPLINAIPILDAYFTEQGFGRIGLLGTNAVMGSQLYGGVTGTDVIAPEGEDMMATNNAYMGMARAGFATDEQRQTVFEMGRKMHNERGADAIILAGTDLFLAFDGHDPGFPVVDAALVHIAAIAKVSMGPSVDQ